MRQRTTAFLPASRLRNGFLAMDYPCASHAARNAALASSRLSAIPPTPTSRVNENARIEQSLRIECFLRGAQGLGEQRRALPVVPRAMIAPDRVVMRNSPSILKHGVERRALDSEPLRA